MKILSWNCNGKFREKFKEIIKLDADIYVIQECENPLTCSSKDYLAFSKNSFWSGENPNKGIGIFAKSCIAIEKNHWEAYCLRNFLSVNINNEFNLLGVWTGKPYIEEYYIYQSINIGNFDLNTIIFGDFNSNKIWDRKHEKRTHTAVVNELKEIGLESVYHHFYHENQGEESVNTFFLYRHLNRGYHIDHCFANIPKVKKYTVLSDESWLEFSDHVPIVLELL